MFARSAVAARFLHRRALGRSRAQLKTLCGKADEDACRAVSKLASVASSIAIDLLGAGRFPTCRASRR
jgi:hypothetical protein